MYLTGSSRRAPIQVGFIDGIVMGNIVL
jgi:hypothetical protein